MASNKYSYKITKLILVLGFFLTRLVNLDADIPFGWKIAMYQHFDEIFYSLPAVNLFHYGTWDIEMFGFKFIDAEVDIVVPIWNLFHYAFLEMFGNALIAIRFPAVLAGTGIYILFLNLIFRFNSDLGRTGNRTNLLLILFALYPLFDPVFFLSNTINEPTIYRLLFASSLFYIFVTTDRIDRKKAFGIGLLSAFSVFFVSLYNLFLLLFSFLLLIDKNHRYNIISYLCGTAIVFLVYLVAFDWLCNVSLLQTLTEIKLSGTRGVQSLHPLEIFMRISWLLSTNYLAFSPALLVFFIFGAIGLPILMRSSSGQITNVNDELRTKINRVWKVSWVYLISYILQNIFISDFVPRKGLIIYFPSLIISYVFISTIAVTYIPKNSRRILNVILLFFIGLVLWKYCSTLSKLLEQNGFYDLERWISVSRTSYLIMCIIFVFSVMAMFFVSRIGIKKFIFSSIIIITLILNVQLLLLHKIINSHHTFKETIVNIGNLPSGYFVGNFSYGFTIGNKHHKPFLYLYTCKVMRKTPDCGHTASEINVAVFSKYFEKVKAPVYTIVQGGIDFERLLNHYPFAEVVYKKTGFRDVANYLDYRDLNITGEDSFYVVRLKGA